MCQSSVLVYKGLNGLAPSTTGLLRYHHSRCSRILRAALMQYLQIPKPYTKTNGFREIAVEGPNTLESLNKLPLELNQRSTYNKLYYSFERTLKTHSSQLVYFLVGTVI